MLVSRNSLSHSAAPAGERCREATEGRWMLPRRGVIEIELLRRYGRTPPGTRAVGWVPVSKNDDDYFTHVREIHIQVGDDPRAVGGPWWVPWVPPRGCARPQARSAE